MGFVFFAQISPYVGKALHALENIKKKNRLNIKGEFSLLKNKFYGWGYGKKEWVPPIL